MTSIVGLIDSQNCVWIGGDSAGTADSGLQTICEDKKVFLLNPPDQPEYQPESPTLLIGGTTSYRILDLLQFKLVVPPYNATMHPKKYLVTLFVDAIRDTLKTSGYEKKEEGEEQGGEFLVGWQGKLYHIYENYQVSEASIGYDAAGMATGIALGVLFATRSLKPEKRIHLALQASTYHCRSVRPPFLIEKVKPIPCVSVSNTESFPSAVLAS